MELVVFIIAGALAIIGALGLIVFRNPVHSALSLVMSLFAVAVLFLNQDAQFLAAVQIIVYAGAIVVLFLFVIMLLGVDRAEDLSVEPIAGTTRRCVRYRRRRTWCCRSSSLPSSTTGERRGPNRSPPRRSTRSDGSSDPVVGRRRFDRWPETDGR